ncbi:MarR family transcriptional regulator [Geodermatophilus nigrescens]
MSRGEAVYEVLRRARPLVLDSARVVEARVRDRGWTVGSRAVVEVLAESGPATVPQVARALSLARQNVQRHVDDLLRLGHARRSANPGHRRSVLVELTGDGRRAFEDLRAGELADLGRLAPGCSAADLATAAAVLAALGRDVRARAASAEGETERDTEGPRP